MNRRPSSVRWLPAPFTFLAVLMASAFSLHAQDSESDNPDGPSGSYNAQITTAGQYDPFTQNARRTVTDLVVPNSSLAFTRYYNSRQAVVAGDNAYFGDGSNWRHSYQWTLTVAERSGPNPPNGNLPVAYTVAYPDGSVVTFRQYRTNSPETPPYWHGPMGTADRLYVPTWSNGADLTLLLSDGSQVFFGGSATHPQYMKDPHGATTQFTYDTGGTGYLTKVTDPSGRWLSFAYQTIARQGGTNWVQLTTVTSSAVLPTTPAGPQAGAHQTVSYAYTPYGTVGSATPYYALASATYNSEAKHVGGGVVAAVYAYVANSGSAPDLLTATDPHYAGAMVNIRYKYKDGSPGYVQEEQNQGNGLAVSHLDRGSSTPTTSTETRGDTDAGGAAITRTFTYGEPSTTFDIPASGGGTTSFTATTGAKGSQPTSVTNFGSTATPSNTAHLFYSSGFLGAVYDAKGNRTAYGREPLAGKVTSVTLPDGRVRSYVWKGMDGSTTNYDSSTATAHPTYPYYLFGVTDERNHTTSYLRDTGTGLVTEIDYPDTSKETFAYQPFTYGGYTFYKVLQHVTKLNATITYGYDAAGHGGSGYQGLLTSVTRSYLSASGTPHTEATQFYYDSADRLSQSVDQRGVTESFVYDACHRLLKQTHGADNSHVDYTYDDNGTRLTVSDELTHVTTTSYDEYRRPVSVTQPVNAYGLPPRVTQYVYDRRDNNNSVIGNALLHTSSAPSYLVMPSGRGILHVYSPNGWLSDQYRGQTNGNINAVSPAQWLHDKQNLDYDPMGQLLTATDAQGYQWTNAYDNCGRLTATTDPLGHVASTAYYGYSSAYAGWLKKTQVPGPDTSATPTFETDYNGYDVNGHVTAFQTPIQTVASAYDTAGDLTVQGDGLQPAAPAPPASAHNIVYAYDQLGRKDTITYYDGGSSSFEKWTYDTSGNVNAYFNRAGAKCSFTYDMRNRLTNKSWNDGTTLATTYTYDAASHLTEVDQSSAYIHYDYDDSGQIKDETERPGNQSVALATTYTRDADGNVTAIAYPHLSSDGYTTAPNYTYDGKGRCSGMSNDNGDTGTYSSYDYNSPYDSNVTLLGGRYLNCGGGGVYTSYHHQANGRIDWVWHYHGNKTTYNADIRVNDYGYFANGQVSWWRRRQDDYTSGSRLENGNGDAYTYYADGSLEYADHDYGGVAGTPNSQGDSAAPAGNTYTTTGSVDPYYNTYAYDAAGNRMQVTTNGASPFNYTADGENRYTSCLGYSDGNANTTTNLTSSWNYVYDAENKLMSASGPGSQTISFSYDGLGRVIGQVNNGARTVFYYAGGQRIQERNLDTSVLSYAYVFDAPGSDSILYRRDNVGAGARLWYLMDLFGNTSHLVDATGTVVEQYLYNAYGAPVAYDKAGYVLSGGSSQKDNRYLFKSSGGYEWLSQARLYYCRARFYLPQHGRWLQPDPIGQAGGLNIYAYCRNDPVNGMDASGLLIDGINDPANVRPYDQDSNEPFDGSNPFSGFTPIDIGTGVDKGWSANNPYNGTAINNSDGSLANSPSSGGGGNSADPQPQWTGGGTVESPNSPPSSGGQQSTPNNMSPVGNLLGGTTTIVRNAFFENILGVTNLHKNIGRAPDYISAQFSVAIPTPWTGTWLSWSGSLSADRYGQWFWSPIGPGVGKSPGLVGGNLTANYLGQLSTPTASQLSNLEGGHSVSLTAGHWLGVNVTGWWGSGFSFGGGFVSPQIGVNYNYSFQGGGNTGFVW